MSELPLSGVRITDFSWLGAGSYTTKIFADLGADVIKLESATRLDALRMTAPYKDGVPGVNRSGYFADRNTSKRSLAIDLKKPQASGIVKALIQKSDIVANNFTPGVMEKFGFGYEAVKAIKPDIIYLAMSMMGRDGPERNYLGYGSSIVALTGLQHLTGIAGREPAGTGTNYPDHIPNPCHAAFAVLAALRHRRRTGIGELIDLAQLEPTLSLLGPVFLDLTVNGRDSQATANQHAWAAPHGVYPCRGEDRWIAIAVTTDEQWTALVSALGSPGWTRHPDFITLPRRRRSLERLDELVGGETRKHDAWSLMAILQEAGVPAGVVQTPADVVDRDPQLKHRNHWISLEHEEMGPTLYNGHPFSFSHLDSQPRTAAPLLGEHTREVLGELLELGEAEIDGLIADGVLK
ncbi:MAG TPA: CoA transferase [Burkholderiales bacterium]|nr:CoA transferase [Burkholderiales bacterium]